MRRCVVNTAASVWLLPLQGAAVIFSHVKARDLLHLRKGRPEGGKYTDDAGEDLL